MRQVLASADAIGVIFLYVGQLPQAEAAFKRNLRLRRQLQDRRGEVAVLSSLGKITPRRGQLEDAERYFRDSLDVAVEVEDGPGPGIADSQTILGEFLARTARRDEGCRMLRVAERRYTAMGMPNAQRVRDRCES